MKFNLLSFFILLFLPFLSNAQTIEGIVLDSDNSPAIGAYVLNLDSEKHCHTNELGRFTIQNPSVGDTLEIIYLGHKRARLAIKELSQKIEIQLEESAFDLGEVVVGRNVKRLNLISEIDTKVKPVNSSQELLTIVPGLFIGQHAGGGKAEQIFIRGFDVDHGTDLSMEVDGMPVNMVSQAHGQGYADLHFMIPETVDFIDYGKGPYYSQKGNFTTAGYVDIFTKKKLDNSLFKFELGSFNTVRTVGLLNLLKSENHNAYIASEFRLSDGPFISSQNFSRSNFMLKYTGEIAKRDEIVFIASNFRSRWDASGQIPTRAVNAGLSRFGAIDDTEGGNTGRTNISLSLNRAVNNHTFIKNSIFYSLYDFELFSNFTFFLNDPENADQIRQFENRRLFGAKSEFNHNAFIGENTSVFSQTGIGFRQDDVGDNTLSRTLNRKTTLQNLSLGDVNESNLYAYSKLEIEKGKFLFNPAIRLDFFKFNYVDALKSQFERQSLSKVVLSPKLNFVYNLNRTTQLFAKSGIGFHSNDTRVVVNEPEKPVLPRAIGADLGAIIKPKSRLIFNAALWWLHLEQEFVYVGDEAIIEPSGASRRIGIDAGFRWQISNQIFANADINYALARSLNVPTDENYIPLAPNLTSTGGLVYKNDKFSSAVQYRWIADRPADESNTFVAEGYFITDLNLSYDWKKFGFGIQGENIFNVDWNETQFLTESRLRTELNSVEEIHFTPGAPFAIRGRLSYRF